MFDRFLGSYRPRDGASPGSPWDEPALLATPGYSILARTLAGVTIGDGLLRMHTREDGPLLQGLVRDSFPEFATRAVPFARDWLGRQFAVDRDRSLGPAGPQLLLLEPGSGEVFEIDEDFVEFFNTDLIDDPDTYLSSVFFSEWRSAGGAVPGPDQCVGFKLPLFLGGTGSVSNLELTDLAVYWDLCGQMRAATKGLPPGTQIGGANVRQLSSWCCRCLEVVRSATLMFGYGNERGLDVARVGLVAVDVPPSLPAANIMDALERGKLQGEWDYDLGVAPG